MTDFHFRALPFAICQRWKMEDNVGRSRRHTHTMFVCTCGEDKESLACIRKYDMILCILSCQYYTLC